MAAGRSLSASAAPLLHLLRCWFSLPTIVHSPPPLLHVCRAASWCSCIKTLWRASRTRSTCSSWPSSLWRWASRWAAQRCAGVAACHARVGRMERCNTCACSLQAVCYAVVRHVMCSSTQCYALMPAICLALHSPTAANRRCSHDCHHLGVPLCCRHCSQPVPLLRSILTPASVACWRHRRAPPSSGT